MALVTGVLPDSLAEELDIEVGDRILAVNGQDVRDILDFHMLFHDEYVEITVQKSNGDILILEVDKEEHEPLGVEWEHPTIDRIRVCANKCIFCFVDQIPRNMRSSLQIRDDDYRLSFLQGNYVTLTNVSDVELARIVALNLSPINISVHTTNPQLRETMLRNKRAGNILQQIRYLAEHNITMHTQIVLCPGYNDKQELERTIDDLRGFFPLVRSLSVVPVGLTEYRDQLVSIRENTKEDAIDTIRLIETWQKRNLQELGVAFVYAADEFYFLADLDVPAAEMYDEFEQTENGIGLIRIFLDELQIYHTRLSKSQVPDKRYLLLTGVSAEKTIRRTVELLRRSAALNIDYHVIPNRFYGGKVTVTGLVTGTDIVEEWRQSPLAERLPLYDEVIIPDIMLKDDENVFLDNMTVVDVERQIDQKLTIISSTAKGLIEHILQAPIKKIYRAKRPIRDYQLRAQRYERSHFFA